VKEALAGMLEIVRVEIKKGSLRFGTPRLRADANLHGRKKRGAKRYQDHSLKFLVPTLPFLDVDSV
jgi:hypothetical protein